MSNLVKVLHFSSHYEDCGIAKYQEQYIAGMAENNSIDNEFFSYSPYQTRIMAKQQFDVVVDELTEKLKDFDLLHIQHEYGFFTDDQLVYIVQAAKKLNKKLVISVHTAPYFAEKPLKLGGLGLHSFLHYARERRAKNIFIRNHIDSFRQADMLLIHNDATAESLSRFGVSSDIMVKLEHPVPTIAKPELTNHVAQNLNKKDGDIIYCVVGFMHKHKGIFGAIKALKYLPENYKLAILGGLHSTTDDIEIYDRVTDLIDTLDLKDRVFITGYVKEDEVLNSYIQECDVCVYPYGKVYYANVSSGSLNLAFANARPVIAYPTRTFQEMNKEISQIVLCDTFSYYELARELKSLDTATQTKRVIEYAELYSWPKMAIRLADLYQKLLSN